MIDLDECRLTCYPSPILARRAQAVEIFDDNLREFVARMIDMMIDNKGIGLAAPQAGISLRLFVISLEMSRETAKVYVNPVITPAGDMESMEEGCLSVPGIYTSIKRQKACTVQAQDVQGHSFTEEAEEMYARCLQHEYDHLEGVTLITRMGATAKLVHRRQIKKLKETFAQGG
jgi:peptide deformylase